MKRSALWFAALALSTASTAGAQGLTMQMTNGWMFAFSGNVNIFGMYQSQGDDGTVASLGASSDVRGSGVLPDRPAPGVRGVRRQGKGRRYRPRGAVRVRAAGPVRRPEPRLLRRPDRHAPGLPDRGRGLGPDPGRQGAGLFGRQNILNDQTLFGVGATGERPRAAQRWAASASATSIRSSSAQMHLLDTRRAGPASSRSASSIPRLRALHRAEHAEARSRGDLEGEFLPVGQRHAAEQQGSRRGRIEDATGMGGGATWSGNNFSLQGSGYWGSGIGTTLGFRRRLGTRSTSPRTRHGDLRDSYGYFAQLTFTAGKATFAGSYGIEHLSSTGASRPSRPRTPSFPAVSTTRRPSP